ncbi:hypothetical protein D3C86_1914810 [compost metagenome]
MVAGTGGFIHVAMRLGGLPEVGGQGQVEPRQYGGVNVPKGCDQLAGKLVLERGQKARMELPVLVKEGFAVFRAGLHLRHKAQDFRIGAARMGRDHIVGHGDIERTAQINHVA